MIKGKSLGYPTYFHTGSNPVPPAKHFDMKYFVDTEFLEGEQQRRIFGLPLLGLRWDKSGCAELYKVKTKPTIDLISIGIVSETGREYYAISKDFNLVEAWNRFDLKPSVNYGEAPDKVYWIRENVLRPIFVELHQKENVHDAEFTLKYFNELLQRHGKTNAEIADEVKNFCGSEPEFYAYFADYDWVVFCWLFGKMVQLPQGFPKYCRDLKQMLDDKIDKINAERIDKSSPLVTTESVKINHPNFPKQEDEHIAIVDARWDFELYKFIKSL